MRGKWALLSNRSPPPPPGGGGIVGLMKDVAVLHVEGRKGGCNHVPVPDGAEQLPDRQETQRLYLLRLGFCSAAGRQNKKA